MNQVCVFTSDESSVLNQFHNSVFFDKVSAESDCQDCQVSQTQQKYSLMVKLA